MMAMRMEKIVTALKRVFQELGISDVEPALEHPAEFSHGDYSTNGALIVAKKRGENPKALAEKIVSALGNIAGVEKIEVAGAGFINFFLTRDFYSNVLKNIGIDWGKNDARAGKKVMVEYTDPNPFKEFHIGHLMSNAIGEAISRLVEFSGAEVTRANYQGDVGPHVAKALWGKMQKPDVSWGAAYTFGSDQYETNKGVIDEINKKVYEKSDPTINALYDAGRKESLEHFEHIYRTLGTTFDFYFFESDTAPTGLTLVHAHPEVFEESEGAVVFRGEKVGLHTRVFITSKGLPTYETKDLGLAVLKGEVWPMDLSITVTASEQEGYFAVMRAALKECAPECAAKITHVTHGMMQLAIGKMSSRKGNVITGESLIEDMRAKALAKMENRDLGEAQQAIADSVAVAAIKYAVLKQNTGKNIIFDPEQSLSFEGDSGPYLQYSHVRALSILRKAE